MTFSMMKFDEFEIDGTIIKFYDGIDFDFVINYDKDELIVIFIDSWKSTVKRYERDSKIDNILENSELEEVPNIDNNWIIIYQTNGNLEIVSDIVKKKLKAVSIQCPPYKLPWVK